MDKEERVDVKELMKHLHEEDLSSREMYHTIQTLGRLNCMEARTDIEHFLTNPDPELRMVALKVLTRYWRLSEYWDTAVEFLSSDPDIDCRMKGANALGYLKMNTSDPETLKVLAQFVKNENEDDLVREAAYAAMWKVLHYNPREQLHFAAKSIDWTKEVDWKMVNQYTP